MMSKFTSGKRRASVETRNDSSEERRVPLQCQTVSSRLALAKLCCCLIIALGFIGVAATLPAAPAVLAADLWASASADNDRLSTAAHAASCLPGSCGHFVTGSSSKLSAALPLVSLHECDERACQRRSYSSSLRSHHRGRHRTRQVATVGVPRAP